MRKLLLLTTVFISFLSTDLFANTPLDSIGVTKVDGKMHIRYLVSPGETVYGISTHYGVSISNLMEINPDLENGLKVGQVLNIPYNKEYLDARAEAKSSSKVIHKVQPGETLFGLSKKYGVELGDLLKWNGMELKAGQDLVVGVKEEKPEEQKSEQDIEVEKIEEEKEQVKAEKEYAKENPEMVATKEKDVIYHDKYDYDPDFQQVLIIPFDPHLYFSDADDEIAARSNIHRTMVREVFRRRLNAMLDPPGYETIHLMGGENPDTLADLNKIYSSVNYNYQERLYSETYKENYQDQKSTKKSSFGQWLDKQKGKLFDEGDDSKEKGKYFGVKVRDQGFYDYFNTKYSVDYYVFINQFEVITDYENCLDRAAQNFRRYFVTHYSIFDKEGNQISGNKFRVYYNSNSNSVMQIVADNVPQIAERIMAELPPAAEDRKSVV